MHRRTRRTPDSGRAPLEPGELPERVEALERLLPEYRPEHEQHLRWLGGLGAPQRSGDALDRLKDRLRVLLAERDQLLIDQRSSIRARTSPARYRLRSWRPSIRARTRFARRRLRLWRSARIGILNHHRPVPLEVPRRYRWTRPPRPAPALSIVTPSYQQVSYIGQTIRSVLEQGYPALEYVVQDGGSTDGTVEVLRRHPRIARWESRPDGGQANAINAGFDGSTGEIMAYLNADDVLLPGALAYVARHFVRHPTVDAVYGHRVLIDGDGNKVGIWAMPPHDPAVLEWADYVPQETLFWRRRLWDRAGGHVDESFRLALDWDLLLRFQAAGARIVRVPRYLGAFRVHDEQKSQTREDDSQRESALLRERCHGRRVTEGEAWRRVQAYRRRQVIHHTLHRITHRLPLPRESVPWLG